MKAIDKFDYPEIGLEKFRCRYSQELRARGCPVEKGLEILYCCNSPMETRQGWDNLFIVCCSKNDEKRCPQAN